MNSDPVYGPPHVLCGRKLHWNFYFMYSAVKINNLNFSRSCELI
jgi:hypothetical protein